MTDAPWDRPHPDTAGHPGPDHRREADERPEDRVPQETRDVEAHAAAVGDDPFAPTGIDFRPVSPGLVKARLITSLGWLAVALVGAIVLGVLLSDVAGWWLWLPTVVMAGIMVWVAWLIPRQVRAIGYAETAEDLLIRKGIMFRSLVVVPYGRLQYVDVNAGPLDRAFGVAKVQLHTASASTDAVLPGLPPREAARLRDRLSEAGEAQLAGL